MTHCKRISAFDTEDRRTAHGEIEVGRIAPDGGFEQPVDVNQSCHRAKSQLFDSIPGGIFSLGSVCVLSRSCAWIPSRRGFAPSPTMPYNPTGEVCDGGGF